MFTTVAILGAASPAGQALAAYLARCACGLRLCDPNAADAERLAEQLRSGTPRADVHALTCAATASWEADVVLLALPLAAQAEAARQIAPFVTQKTVCSVADAGLDDQAVVLAELQRLLPHSRLRRMPACPEPLPARSAATLAQLLDHADPGASVLP